MKNRPWTLFLFLRVPIAALALAAAAQALAVFLSGVPMWRDRTDELALAVLKDPKEYRILLLADSITRNATARFSLGAPGEVANLAVNGYIGISGSLLLLTRYLSAHPAPQHVVVAFAPGVYHYQNSADLARYNLWHTFSRPDEHQFLATYVPGVSRPVWYPAILDLQERIVEPLFSFLKERYLALRKRDGHSISAGFLTPRPETPVEFATHAESDATDGSGASDLDLAITPMNAQSLSRLCELSKQYGFRVTIVWPPMPMSIRHALQSSGALAELEATIRSIMEGGCRFSGFPDFSEMRSYTDASFHHDMMHLFGDGWEQRYASDLSDFLTGLPQQIPIEAAK